MQCIEKRLFSAEQYSVVQYGAVQLSTVWCSAVHYGTVQCNTVQCRGYICIVQTSKPTTVVGLQGSRSAVYLYMSHTAFYRHSNSDPPGNVARPGL